MEEERGTRGAMQIGEKVDVGIGCRKRSLGHGYPRTRSGEANVRAHYGLTYRIGDDDVFYLFLQKQNRSRAPYIP